MSTRISMHRSRLFPALHTLVASGALVVALAGCVLEDAPLDLAAFDDLDLTPVSPAGDQWNDCSTWDCNKNHPQLTGFPVPELHEGGEPTEDDVRIVSFEKNGVPYHFDVTAGQIRGLDAPGGNAVLTYGGVIGSVITVTNDVRTWEIRIADYTYALQYWYGVGTVWAYHLEYRQISPYDTQVDDVCNEPPSLGTEPGWPMGYETYAILIDDERYDREKIKVEEDDADAQGWFNIACAGTALAKMVLLHADPNEASGNYPTTKAQRTATLKMLTADYFGTGHAFTQPGQRLLWTSAMTWHPLVLDPAYLTAEAVWTEHGARCLSEPRLSRTVSTIRTEIEEYRLSLEEVPDPLPSCGPSDSPPIWPTDDVWRTYLPPLSSLSR